LAKRLRAWRVDCDAAPVGSLRESWPLSIRRAGIAAMDGVFFEFRRQLDDKARLYGASVVVADRWFPSSKTCSCCGSVKAELDLSQRVFRCGPCGLVADRDCNACEKS
jgi:putative transposase